MAETLSPEQYDLSKPSLEVVELGKDDAKEIRELEEKAWIPELQADRETIERRLELGHTIFGLRFGEKLIGKTAFCYSNFDPKKSPEEQNFPQNFKEFSSIPKPEQFNAAFFYDLDVDPEFRGEIPAKTLIDAAVVRVTQKGCRYGVADVRVPSYNGSLGFEQERRPQKPEFKKVIDKYVDPDKKIVPIAQEDLDFMYLEPTMRFYHQMTGAIPLWIAKDFIPQDEPSGGFRIIAYRELKKAKMSLSKEWSVISEKSYGEEFIKELSGFLKEQKVQSILECGCGSGHILKGLAQEGFDCLGIDDDLEMIAAAKSEKVPKARFMRMNWLRLGRFGGQFDAVVCRGNSLPYAVSWNRKEIDPEKAQKAVVESLQKMWVKVKPGGILYIDTVPKAEVEKGGGPVKFDAPGVNLEGTVEYDLEHRIRHMKGGGTIHGEEFEGEAYSYVILPEEIESILRDLGAEKVWSPELENEKNYQIICARKRSD